MSSPKRNLDIFTNDEQKKNEFSENLNGTSPLYKSGESTGVLSPSKSRDDVNGKPVEKIILINSSKKEQYTVKQGFKKFFRKIRAIKKVEENKTSLSPGVFDDVKVAIFGAPRLPFTDPEIALLKNYLEDGGSLFFLFREKGTSALGENLNNFLANYGIFVNPDSVLRTVYYKYLHPKEVFVSNGEENRINSGLSNTKEQQLQSAHGDTRNKFGVFDTKTNKDSELAFVYPYGSTLNVQKPAVPILSSVSTSKSGKGRLCVVGSADIKKNIFPKYMFSDDFLLKENNAGLGMVLMKWLLGDKNIMLTEGGPEPDISEYNKLPEIEALSERLRPYFTKLFDTNLFKFHTGLIPEAVTLYKKLGIKKEPLSLIPPQFECPMPPLQPAVFPPCMF
eukprot:GSMAST32.ASY1.ANO1.2592.1 assembled CDS